MNYGALATFAFVASITPGPNNVMLWASGLNYGFRRTLRHIAGVNLGFVSLLLATALGLGALFERIGWLSPALRLAGSAYLAYLAYRIATAGRAEAGTTSRPMTFVEAAAFQYVNPKAWVMGITAAGAFIDPGRGVFAAAGLMALVFGLVNLPCIMTWAAAGSAIGRLLTDERWRRALNIVLALLLVGTIYLINA
jgi:threonine/homoserine/homoserine lactone efflux protein